MQSKILELRILPTPQILAAPITRILVFSRASGKYFKWAAHDDVLGPRFIEKCVEILEQNPGVVLAKSYVVIIDEFGTPTGVDLDDLASSAEVLERFSRLTRGHGCRDTCGVMRSEIVAKMALRRNYTDSDRTFLAHMSLYGPFYQIPEFLFFKRTHPETSINVFPDWYERMAWFGEEYRNRMNMPHWQQERHYFECITLSEISAKDKCYCYVFMFKRLFIQGRCRGLVKDLLLAAKFVFRKTFFPANFG